jgi:HK97 family phage major capsid protein
MPGAITVWKDKHMATNTHATAADAFTPEDFGELVNLAVQAKSIAANSATVFSTNKVKVNFPLWVSDPAVGWYNELDTIATTDGSTGEVESTPTKTAGLFLLSNELKDDSDPAIADLAGAALGNQIARAVDAAYFAATTTKGPDGLLGAAYTTVDTGPSLTNLDPFVSARYAAEAAGSKLTSWIVRPAVAEALSKLKVETGSNQSLLQFVDDGILVAGLPVLVSDQVDANTLFWGIPSAHVMFVQRSGTAVEQFPNVQQDGTWIRAISRLGLAFLNEAGVVRGWNSVKTYTLNFNGATGGTAVVSVDGLGPSATIAFNAANSAVKTAIVGIDDGIVAADVTVTGSAGVYTVTVPGVLTANGASLTGGSPAATATVTRV